MTILIMELHISNTKLANRIIIIEYLFNLFNSFLSNNAPAVEDNSEAITLITPQIISNKSNHQNNHHIRHI